MKHKLAEPLLDRVLIEPLPVASVTKGGIIIPDSAKEKPLKGIVYAVGTGTRDEPMQLKEGDVVLFEKHGGQEIEVEGRPYLLVRQNAISCILHVEEIPHDTSALKPISVLPAVATDEAHLVLPPSDPKNTSA